MALLKLSNANPFGERVLFLDSASIENFPQKGER